MTELIIDVPNEIAKDMRRVRFINWNEKLVKPVFERYEKTTASHADLSCN